MGSCFCLFVLTRSILSREFGGWKLPPKKSRGKTESGHKNVTNKANGNCKTEHPVLNTVKVLQIFCLINFSDQVEVPGTKLGVPRYAHPPYTSFVQYQSPSFRDSQIWWYI